MTEQKSKPDLKIKIDNFQKSVFIESPASALSSSSRRKFDSFPNETLNSIENALINCNGEKLIFGWNILNQEGVNRICSLLIKFPNLKLLRITMNNIHSNELEQICNSLKNSNLTNLFLDYNKIDAMGAFHLSKLLISNNLIKEIDLSGNKLGFNGIEHLKNALVDNKNTTLNTLILANMNMNHDYAKLLSQILISNRSLNKLSLQNNELGNKGTEYLSLALKQNTSLEYLNLQKNNIENEGALQLYQMLLENKTIKSLNISDNLIDDSSVNELCSVLKNNTSLTSLDISNNKLGEFGFRQISIAIKSNSTLTNLFHGVVTTKEYLNAIDNQISENLNSSKQFFPISNQSTINSTLNSTNNIQNDQNTIEYLKMKISQLEEENKNLKEQSSVLDILFNLNQKDNIILELKKWKSILIDPFKNTTIPTLNEAKELLNKIENLSHFREYLFSIISIIGDEKIEDFRKNFQNWINKRGIIEKYYIELKEIFKSFQEKTLTLKLILNNIQRHELNKETIDIKLINDKNKLMNEISKLKINIRKIQNKIVEGGFNDLTYKSSKLLNSDLNYKSPEIIKIINLLNNKGIFNNRTINDYNIINTKENIKFSKNLEDENVILKMFKEENSSLTRASNEISTLINLQNRPYVLPIQGVFIEENNHENKYIIYVELPLFGYGNLFEWLKRSKATNLDLRYLATKRDINSILNVLNKIILAVCDLHSQRIEHRDLKPENILVDESGNIKIIDYEISRDYKEVLSQTIKTQGFTIMSLRYAPPERKNPSSTYTHQFGSWDIYSLGIIIYECLCNFNNNPHLNNFSIDSIKENLSNSGYNDEIYNIIISMIDSENYRCKSIFEISKKFNDYIISKTKVNILQQFRFNNNFINLNNLVKKYNNNEKFYFKFNENNIIKSFTELMKKLNNSNIGNNIILQLIEKNNDINFIEYLNDILYNLKKELFQTENCSHWFLPNDDYELQEQMESFGKLIFHCIVKGYPLHIQMSPIFYILLSGFTPRDLKIDGIFELFQKYYPDKAHDYLKASLKILEEDVDVLKDLYFGSNNNNRYKNTLHILNGLKHFMQDEELLLLNKIDWDDLELFCCGPENISSDILLMLLKKSLYSEHWEKDANTKNTRNWLEIWIKNQSSDGIRKFLQFYTGFTYIPTNDNIFELNIYPYDSNINSIGNKYIFNRFIKVTHYNDEEFFKFIENELKQVKSKIEF